MIRFSASSIGLRTSRDVIRSKNKFFNLGQTFHALFHFICVQDVDPNTRSRFASVFKRSKIACQKSPPKIRDLKNDESGMSISFEIVFSVIDLVGILTLAAGGKSVVLDRGTNYSDFPEHFS